ncbi:hypothetical protein NBH00_21610 [Paraconexibacter antarcticus]|uniref:DUF3828 domain-containing protein n=1 Tax=Paraconexibacter antarcticus TaxID=2949664 RepID=A0ABY5DT74_9ACTN|nr:hypothetical protein [Paraconexibacter antarcticus]UTI63927.1 hypothetical protein NBH00_21610 [Paraconexibacter antarcticus]
MVLLSAATAALSAPAGPGHPAPPSTAAAPPDVRAAAASARAFAEDYLAWMTAHHRAGRVTAATPALRARLTAERVRPSRARRRERQITELRTDLTTPTTGTAVVKVTGRDVQLRLTLTLVRSAEGWVVSDVRS